MSVAARSLRILFHAGVDVSERMGHAVHVRRLTDALVRRGHRVRLVAVGSRQREAPRVAAGAGWLGPPDGLVEIPRASWPKIGMLTLQARTAMGLRRELEAFRPDVLLTRAESFAAAPLLVPLETCLLCVEVNGLFVVQARADTRRLLFPLGAALEERLVRRAAVTAAPSLPLLRELATRFHIDASRLSLVPNGTFLPELDPIAAIALRREHGVRDDEFLLGFVGNLSPWQSLPLVFESLAPLKDRPWRFWIVGDGARSASVQQAAARYGLADRVRLFGSRDEEDAARLSQATQVLIAPYDDAFLTSSGSVTLKVLQAMACDRPVLISAITASGADTAPGSRSESPARSAAAAKHPLPAPFATGDAVSPGNPRVMMELFATPKALGFVDDRSSDEFAGELVSNTVASWTRALADRMEEWIAAESPLKDWPWVAGNGPGRRFVAENRTWDHTAAAWERSMLEALSRRAG